MNSESKRRYSRKYYARNRARLLAYAKQYQQDHKEEVAARNKKYYAAKRGADIVRRRKHHQDNKEQERATQHTYWIEHRDECLAQKKVYYRKNREAILAKNRKRRRDFKRMCIESVGGKCIQCGFDNIAALDFHHRDATTKIADIAFLVDSHQCQEGISGVLKEELAKCELLCRNCHAILHAGGEMNEQTDEHCQTAANY